MDMTMHKDDPVSFGGSGRIEVITSVQRRRRWTTAQKVAIVEETMRPGQSVSSVARLHGIAPNMLFAWKRRMTEGGRVAVATDEDVVGYSGRKRMQDPSLSHRRPRFGCLAGTFSPSRRQIRATRFAFTRQPLCRSIAVMRR